MIVDIIQSNNQLMKEQCQMLQVIGENQKQLAEIMKGVVEPPQAGGPPSGGSCGHGGISPPAPGYIPPGTMPQAQPVPAMPALAPIRAEFVAPNMETRAETRQVRSTLRGSVLPGTLMGWKYWTSLEINGL